VRSPVGYHDSLQQRPPSVPTVLISLPLEGSPSLWLADCGPGDRERLLAWLAGNPRQLAIVGEAIDLQAEAEAR
jgi:hypothetical protein